MICKISDFIVEFENKGNNFKELLNNYICSQDDIVLKIHISQEDAIKERKQSLTRSFLGIHATTCAYRKLAEWLPLHNAFVFHSAVFDVDGTGIALAAHSGTGKTTHMLLWQKLIGDRLKIVNGDKPIVRFFDDEPETPYAYGTPWNGKEHLGCNMRTPLKNICFIERAEKWKIKCNMDIDAAQTAYNKIFETEKENETEIQLCNK